MNPKPFPLPGDPDAFCRDDCPMIGGIPQHIQIRSTNPKHPVLLFLHGGPGGAVSGLSHIHHAGWTDHFTVVNWDQRGSGRTYSANPGRKQEISQTGTMEDYMRDLDDVIAYLHTVLSFERLILVGFSWGSAIGSEYARRHPEHLLCYVGIGQHVCYRDAILTTCRTMLDMVPPDSRDAAKLRAIIDTFPAKPVWDRTLMHCMRHFMPLSMRLILRHAKRITPSEILCSPQMTFREKWSALLPDYSRYRQSYATMLGYDFRHDLHFDVPVLFVFGQEENVCPASLLEAVFPEITAPEKQLAVIPEASHSCYFDQPDAFMEVLLSFLQRI